jgi:hypothetical protein
MKISWKRLGVLAGVVAVLVASQPSIGDPPFKQFVVKCNPNGSQCHDSPPCGQENETPKLCGETKDGPFFSSTFTCCCCTEESKGRYFFGE